MRVASIAEHSRNFGGQSRVDGAGEDAQGMFALYYTDTHQFIAAPERWVHAIALAEMLSSRTSREVAVVYNGADGSTEIYCRCEVDGVMPVPQIQSKHIGVVS